MPKHPLPIRPRAAVIWLLFGSRSKESQSFDPDLASPRRAVHFGDPAALH